MSPERYVPRLLGFMALLVVSGCASMSATQIAQIRIVEDTVQLHRSTDAAWFHVTAVIQNDSERPLYRECPVSAERSIEDKWEPVWGSVCTLSLGEVIAPGDSVTVAIDVVGSAVAHTGPPLDPRMSTGRYRLVFSIHFGAGSNGITEEIPVANRASSAFIVRE